MPPNFTLVSLRMVYGFVLRLCVEPIDAVLDAGTCLRGLCIAALHMGERIVRSEIALIAGNVVNVLAKSLLRRFRQYILAASVQTVAALDDFPVLDCER